MTALDPIPDRLTVAHTHRAAGQWQDAIAHYQELLSDQTHAIDAWFGLALCREELGDLAAAWLALLRCGGPGPAG